MWTEQKADETATQHCGHFFSFEIISLKPSQTTNCLLSCLFGELIVCGIVHVRVCVSVVSVISFDIFESNSADRVMSRSAHWFDLALRVGVANLTDDDTLAALCLTHGRWCGCARFALHDSCRITDSAYGSVASGRFAESEINLALIFNVFRRSAAAVILCDAFRATWFLVSFFLAFFWSFHFCLVICGFFCFVFEFFRNFFAIFFSSKLWSSCVCAANM